jgi:hypothetical protein
MGKMQYQRQDFRPHDLWVPGKKTSKKMTLLRLCYGALGTVVYVAKPVA